MKNLIRRIGRPSPATVIASIALIVALGGVAHSAVPGPDGKIHACFLIDDADPDFSYAYISEHDFACQPGETRISWAQDGAADPDDIAAAQAEAAKYDPRQQITALVDAHKKIDKTKPPKLKDPNALKEATKDFKPSQRKAIKEFSKELNDNRRAQARYYKKLNQMDKLMLEAAQEGVDQQALTMDVLQQALDAFYNPGP